MSLVALLKAAHCRSTHHYLAIDALSYLRTPQAKHLGQLLLNYYEEYLDGAKAPDTRFKDFQNHVLHVQDNYWGGAIRESHVWVATAIEHLNAGRWKKAAFALGVLSHYVTDPMMPLHTEQSDAESVVHRPLEWNVCKAYPQLSTRLTEVPPVSLQLSSGDKWLTQLIAEGADFANRHYEQMIEEHLKLCKSQKRPALNAPLEEMLLGIFAYTLAVWAAVLERVTDEITTEIPPFTMRLTTVLATIDVPFAWIVRKVGDVQERAAVQRLLEEYQSTGEVQKNLPKECKVVRQERLTDRKGFRFGNPSLEPKQPQVKTPSAIRPQQAAPPVPTREVSRDTFSTVISQRSSSVSVDSPLVDAPSIGPKTAARFEKIGITTIRAFLQANVSEMIRRLDTSWIREQTIIDWQDQAHLVCLVPALCGYKSQLLVGVGCRSRAQLAAADVSDLLDKIEEYAETSDGKRILRSAKVPVREDLLEWVSSARKQREAA